MLRWMINLSAPWKFFLFFGVPLIQYMIDRAGGPGTKIGGIVFGFYPSTTLYFIWLLSIQIQLERNLSKFILKSTHFAWIRYELLVVIVIFLPFEIWWTNILLNNTAEWIPVMMGAAGFISIVFLAVVLHCLTSVSRMIVLLNSRSDEVPFRRYAHVFFYFLMGPVTIWFLQSHVMKACESRWSDFGKLTD